MCSASNGDPGGTGGNNDPLEIGIRLGETEQSIMQVEPVLEGL